jgi:hypothetical protein
MITFEAETERWVESRSRTGSGTRSTKSAYVSKETVLICSLNKFNWCQASLELLKLTDYWNVDLGPANDEKQNSNYPTIENQT